MTENAASLLRVASIFALGQWTLAPASHSLLPQPQPENRFSRIPVVSEQFRRTITDFLDRGEMVFAAVASPDDVTVLEFPPSEAVTPSG